MAFITTAQNAILFDPEHRGKWGTNLDAAQVLGGDGKPNAGLRLGWHPQGQMRLVRANGKDVKNKKVKARPHANGKGLSFAIGSSLEILQEDSLTFPDGTLWTPERGLTRVNVILDKKPTEPFWDFELDLPVGAVLDYQPALTPQEIDMGASRPAWCVGSYTICVGGVKFGHFPRPFAVDANGAWTWGTLTIWQAATGQWMLRKAIDATWLANAAYPVLVDDTFGYTSKGGSIVGPLVADVRMAFNPNATPASTGTLNSVSAYMYSQSGTIPAAAAVYTAVAGTPTTKVDADATGQNVTTTSGILYTFPMTGSAITANSAYHPTLWCDNATMNLYMDTVTLAGPKYVSDAYDLDWPAGFGSPSTTSANRLYSIFVTYTPGGTAWTKTVIETLSLSEILPKDVGKAVTESLGLAESVPKAVGKAVTESLGLAETSPKAVGKILADSLGLSDVAAAALAVEIVGRLRALNATRLQAAQNRKNYRAADASPQNRAEPE